MDFWKYNIGDEITTKDNLFGVVNVYRVVERRIELPTRRQESSFRSKSSLLYIMWNVKSGLISVMNENVVDSLVKAKGSIIKRDVADTVNVTIKKDSDNMPKQTNGDAVNHPSHYQGKIEAIDFIEDKHLNFNLGNCIKYIARCHLKHKDNPVEDLKKARWYLDREIGNMEKEREISEIKKESKWMPNTECVIKKGE